MSMDIRLLWQATTLWSGNQKTAEEQYASMEVDWQGIAERICWHFHIPHVTTHIDECQKQDSICKGFIKTK